MFQSRCLSSVASQTLTGGLLRTLFLSLGWLLLLQSGPGALSQTNVPAAAVTPAPSSFNVEAATRAYLDRLTPAEKRRSDSYFEGGYWLQLWDFLYGLGIAAFLLSTRLSARMRDLAQRITRFKFIHTAAYWVQYLLVTALLAFPLTVYEGFFREHHYGMSNQNFAGWFGDFSKGLLVGAIMGSIALVPVFALVRRRAGRWHIYASLVLIVFLAFSIVISPVFIAPLFNKYTPLTDAKVRDPILSLARANGIPATEVYRGSGTIESPCPPRTSALILYMETFSSIHIKVFNLAVSSTPDIPMTLFLGK